MALSDLELLELVERAQDERQGPIGPQGVGIRSIEQPTADAVIIALTDGRTKELRLTAGPKGDPGEAGKPGQDGKPGPAGSPGRAGAPGVGVAGAPGRDGTSIDTAIVNADGNLLLGLTDGNVLNVGRVVGPPGATGAAGPTGLPGRAGRDGKTILSGTHAPSDDEGDTGDFWIDTSSALFDFYGKGASGWRKLTTLRAPQTPVGGKMTPVAGGGSGGGGGGGVDLPPVIIDKDPPAKGNNQGPVRQGDLWFDSDQLALYVATKDAGNSIVWVICIPGVTGVPGTQTASAPVVYPKAVDGEEYVNPITNVTYRYNAAKKQWINVNGGIVSVQDKPPLTPQTGSLWYDTESDELTLYIYTGAEWVPAAPPVSLDGINATIDAALIVQNDLLARVQAGETEQTKIKLSIEELSITKGSVARYQVKDVAIGVASRNGELYVNSAKAEDVTGISFAPFDINGQPTKPTHVGDIVEFVETTRSVGQVTRYRITSGTEAQALTVAYLSGDNNFAVDENEEVYIYPQNEEGVSKDYVDAQIDKKLDKTDANVVNNNFRIKSDSKTYVSTSGGLLALNHVKEPTAGHNAATKDYVDSKFGGVGIAAPAQLSWLWEGDKGGTTTAPSAKKFLRTESSGVDYLRFSFETYNGVDLGDALFSDTNVTTEYGPIGCIWYRDTSTGKWRLKMQFRVQNWRWNYNQGGGAHFEFGLSSRHGRGWDSFAEDAYYYVTVGGFF